MRAISTLVLAAATAVGSIGLAAGGTAGALIAAELTGGSASAGVPLGAVVVGSAGGALLISRVTRHAGRITGLAVGYAIGSLGAALVVAATVAASLGLVVAGSVVMGVANAAVYLTRYAAADLVPGAARGRAVGVVLSGAAVGAVAGPNLLGPSGELAAGLGLPRFSGLYLVAAVAFPAAGALLGLPGRRAGRPRADRDRRPAPAPGRIAGTRGAVLVLVVTNLVMVAVMAMAPLHLLAHGHDLDVVGVAVSIHVLCMLAPAPLAGWLADRTGPAPVAGLGAGLLATGGLTGAVVGPDSTVGFTAVLAVLGLGWCAGVVAGSAMLVASQPEAERPRAEGIGELAMGLAAGAGATLAGLVVAVGGFPVFAVATAAVSLVILLQVASRPRAAGASAGPAAARSKVSI